MNSTLDNRGPARELHLCLRGHHDKALHKRHPIIFTHWRDVTVLARIRARGTKWLFDRGIAGVPTYMFSDACHTLLRPVFLFEHHENAREDCGFDTIDVNGREETLESFVIPTGSSRTTSQRTESPPCVPVGHRTRTPHLMHF